MPKVKPVVKKPKPKHKRSRVKDTSFPRKKSK